MGGAYVGCCCYIVLDFPTDSDNKSMVAALLLDTDDVDGIRPTSADLSAIRTYVLKMELGGSLSGDMFNDLP
jgi:hypothetical protein